MRLERLILTHFKNYATASFAFDERLNCIVGRNGVGKTNLLDAIHYLALCKSHFSLPDRSIAQHGADFFRIEGNFSLRGKKEVIVAKVPVGKKKVIERNGVPYTRLLEHIGLIPVVMIVPDDTRLATEGSGNRRRFMDAALSQMNREYLEALAAYVQLLKQRNAALKQMAGQRKYDTSLLQTYSEQMAAPAQLIHQQRVAFIEELLPELQRYYALISGGGETVNCRYLSQLSDGDFLTLTKAAGEKDRILSRTSIGIHKDDLLFEIGDYEVKKFASQGQLKSFVLALKLALYDVLKKRTDQQPIFLLDDIFDKLDRHRVRQLLEVLIDSAFGQVFITDTHENRVADLVKDLNTSCKQFVISAGGQVAQQDRESTVL